MILEGQIKHYRKTAEISQEEMAEKIGVSKETVMKWEDGSETPSDSDLISIAELFQISVDELLSNNKTEKKQSECNRQFSCIFPK